MGLEGFSMGNLGLNADLTSAQMATQADQIARRDSEVKIKNIEKADKEPGVKRKDEEEEGNSQYSQEGENGENDEFDEDLQHQLDEKTLEEHPKEFAVRINPVTQEIELFNTNNNRILETISAEELMFLISKLDNASGVLVNRKI